LFLGACRIDDGLTKEVVLQKLLQELGTCECISLEGFDVQSLNEMMSEALCLPRRKTLPLSGIIHEKTQGMPLFVVEVRRSC
jgi:ATP-dependent RNA helicase DDX31/DBP7